MRLSTTVVLSLDAELSWGFHDNTDSPVERVTTTRDRHRLKHLISMIAEYHDKYEIEIETMSQVADKVRTNE